MHIMDRYACHVSLRTLFLLKDSVIIVAGLPAHTSNVLQPLYLGVFGSFNESFRRFLSRHTISSSKDA